MPDRVPFRLLGYAVSNYVNIVHAVLLEKGARFALVPTRASQEEAFLAQNPMGKIPVLETPEGPLAETVAIIEYLEEALDGPALLPAAPYARAKARQAINIVQVYVEVPTRSLFPGTFFGQSNSPATIDAARVTLDRGAKALKRLAAPRPFLLGDALTLADLFAFYCLDIAERVSGFVYDRSFLDEAGLRGWFDMMAKRESSQIVLAAFDAVFLPYLVDKNAAYRP